jgi:D-glycero-beta-D-manno-heptose-7-phosphate kinase
MNRPRAEQLLRGFHGRKLLVIGDLILDEFIWGKVNRISPEAPVPVVEVDRESYFPGGAANVARNLREFTDGVLVMGMVGADAHGEHLKKLLAAQGIELDCVQQDASYQTIVKTRIIARHQQVVRVDRERKAGLTAIHTDRVLSQLDALMPRIDAIIFEDYGKGLLTQELVDQIAARARAAHKILTVDPNPNNRIAWHLVTAVTPNRAEAFAAAGHSASDPIEPVEQDEALIEVGTTLLKKWAPDNLLITLGEHGMMLFRGGAEPFHIPTRAQEVFDVSGAGDTAIALFTLALCAGATPAEAAEISNHAAGIVVGKLGTATVTPAELIESFEADAG